MNENREKINRELTEKFFGCWHVDNNPDNGRCKKCGTKDKSYMPLYWQSNRNPDFFNPDGKDWWRLLQKLKEDRSHYDGFKAELRHIVINGIKPWLYCTFDADILLSTETGPVAVWSYYCKEKGKRKG